MAGADTKQLILEEATHLFYERGFSGASIRDIARAAGVSNPTVYFYFRDKNYILFEIVERIAAVLTGRLYEVTQLYDDPVACLQAMVRVQVCFIEEKHEGTKIFLEEQHQLPKDLKRKAYRQHRRFYHLYYDKIREIKKMNLMGDVDETVVTFSIFAMMNWTFRWYVKGRRLAIEDIGENIISMILHGILKGDSRAHRGRVHPSKCAIGEH
jgi:TetR/AcrR family transcriptional regulator